MAGIGIVGTGISGPHLALRLQQLGVATTLYTEPGPDPRVSRLANAVVRFEQTCARERALRVNHWEFPDVGISCVHLSQHGDPGSSFCGALSRQASSVDSAYTCRSCWRTTNIAAAGWSRARWTRTPWCASRVVTT